MVVGLLVLAQQSFQMSLRNPVAETNNCKIDFTRLGLVLTKETQHSSCFNELFTLCIDNYCVQYIQQRGISFGNK
jgi:hypothetical protein